MRAKPNALFESQHQLLLKHLVLTGRQPKSIDAYTRAMRRVGAYFAHQIDDLNAAQLTD